MRSPELSSCGVGFVASLNGEYSYQNLCLGLKALKNLEHRGGTSADLVTGDGAGVLTDIPHELLGVRDGDAVASLFLPRDPTRRVRSLRIFEETFQHAGLQVLEYREVPVRPEVLSPSLNAARPEFLMAFIKRPEQCTTRHTFERMLYSAKQLTRSRLREAGILKQFFFTSLSAGTLVYKALTTAENLAEFYPDLKNPKFRTRFVLFHRRFSTNTATAWDTAQPFRVVAHNGEINTISGNRAWAYARERALGLDEDELLTHFGISDSGSVNEVIEALLFRSSIPHPEDILAIMMPKANDRHPFYRFWSRAMEPWDGPALLTFSDGRTVGARLDRSGFRPCRWARTADRFYLSSEAGSFEIPEDEILAKGSLSGGGSVSLDVRSGVVHFKDASLARENLHATFDPRLNPLPRLPLPNGYVPHLDKLSLFGYTEEDARKVIAPMIVNGKEAMGSMGDTARLPVLSGEVRSLFDFFYQKFAQVTNPPLDYLREKLVTDMTVVLGRKPNIFEPKELLPLKLGIALEGPVLTLGQMAFLRTLDSETGFEGAWPASITLDTTFLRSEGVRGALDKIEILQGIALEAVKVRTSVIILSDREAAPDRPPIPAILVVAALTRALEKNGMRLRASIVVETGEVKDTHGLAVLVAFGATAVCPYLLLELATHYSPTLLGGTAPEDSNEERELKLVKALESGLLKIMAKMGISVLQSYQGAELFTILGFSADVHERFFPRQESPIGGLALEQILGRVLRDFAPASASLVGRSGLRHNFLYQEDAKHGSGEKHSMTLPRSKIVHRLVAALGTPLASVELYDQYLKAGSDADPISIRHLWRPKLAPEPLKMSTVQSRESVLKTFGSGAMSFGAISAESQRDIILAMSEIGGRSNSGEGGENPYYYTDGITAHTKQVASGRFGVTAEYLIAGKEIQIKIAQGAKPGEGGQLMAVKVGEEIARARHSDVNVDLISPPPMHDIYSIEDLKQLICEFRQLYPAAKISVKLVSGENIGTIAVGVAKAGADIIQISGHDGGTGAASLSSMKHAGLPWELGLWEVHRALLEHQLRHCVTLRVDGGLATGQDLVSAAMLGAEEFDFGKLLLVAEGCIMARVCEKNTCPTGIATHDPKFKRLYRGSKERIIALLESVAEDVRRHLSRLGVATLTDLVGRSDLLEVNPAHLELVRSRGIDLSRFFVTQASVATRAPNPFIEGVSHMNDSIVHQAVQVCAGPEESQRLELTANVLPKDRAVLATLNGMVAADRGKLTWRAGSLVVPAGLARHMDRVRWIFHGSAGQGFAVFNQPGISAKLFGEANDSVAKSMSGGRIVVTPSRESELRASSNTIIGNCALYGATGGVLFVNGLAGNRFAVRNSGAVAVVEGVGMHACEYMTRGTVVILGGTGANIGAGMTGGHLYLSRESAHDLNRDYIAPQECADEDLSFLRDLLADYFLETDSVTAGALLKDWENKKQNFFKGVPLLKFAARKTASAQPELGALRFGSDHVQVRLD